MHLKGPTRFGAPTPTDQRRAPRVQRQGQVTITPLLPDSGPLPAITVDVKNVSARGLGFVHDRNLPRGSQFLLTLPRPEADPLEILCTVARTDPAGKSTYSIGAEFTSLAAARSTLVG